MIRVRRTSTRIDHQRHAPLGHTYRSGRANAAMRLRQRYPSRGKDESRLLLQRIAPPGVWAMFHEWVVSHWIFFYPETQLHPDGEYTRLRPTNWINFHLNALLPILGCVARTRWSRSKIHLCGLAECRYEQALELATSKHGTIKSCIDETGK